MFNHHDITQDACMLNGSLRRHGRGWWRHSLASQDADVRAIRGVDPGHVKANAIVPRAISFETASDQFTPALFADEFTVIIYEPAARIRLNGIAV